MARSSLADDATSYAEQGAKALENKNYDSAIDLYSKAIDLCTNYYYAYYSRGLAYEKKNQLESAIKDFTEAIRFDVDINISWHAFSMRGKAYYEQNKLKEAVDDYSMAIKLNPVYVGDRVNRGGIYNLMGKFDLAKDDFDKAIGLSKTNSAAYLGRGGADAGVGDYKQAIIDYGKAIELATNDLVPYWARAEVYMAMEDYSNAITDYSNMARIDPTNNLVFSVRGIVYSKIGRFDKGVADCQMALGLDPNSALANNNLAWLLAIAPDAKLRDGKKAVEYAKKACELTNWKVAYCLGTLAAACAETGNFDEAVKWQEKGIELGLGPKDLKEAKKMLDLYKQKKPYHAELNSTNQTSVTH